MARGAAASAVTQGIGVVTRLQDKFSWAAVAAAGVGAGVGFKVGNSGALANASAKVVRGVVSGATALANAATQSLLEGTNFGDNIAAALPSVVGSLIFDGLSGARRVGKGVLQGDAGDDTLGANAYQTANQRAEGQYGAGARQYAQLTSDVVPQAATEVVVVTASRSQRNSAERVAARIAEDTQAAIRQGIAIGNGLFRSPPPIAVPVGRPMTPRENYIYNAQQQRVISNQSARYAFGALAEGMPVLGDGLAIRTAVRDPSAANIINAGVGLVPLGGDALAASLRANSKAVKTGLNAAESALARAGRLGREGEAAVGLYGPKVGIRIPGANNMRFPDNLTTTTLTEVKNVASQGLTKQLRDYITVSQSTGRTFDLYVRGPLATGGRTDLTQPLADAIRRGDINLHYIPGTF
jgi:lipoprotein-anchoring transpeptidase ErfK/SrfK